MLLEFNKWEGSSQESILNLKYFFKNSSKKQHNPIANALWINYTFSKDHISRTKKKKMFFQY